MLTPNQYKCIEMMLSHPNYTNVQIAKELDIHPMTISKWKRNHEFKEELKNRMHEQWEDAEATAQRTMIDLAASGSFNASKYILDNMGYAPTQKLEADLKTDISIKIEE